MTKKLKKGIHRHFCCKCQILWQHKGTEISNRHKSHCCPGCGAYITEIFTKPLELSAIEWDGTRESSKAKLSELSHRDEFEQSKIRRIYFRVYWLTKK